jgi:YesN/AraC family two-component response regulator
MYSSIIISQNHQIVTECDLIVSTVGDVTCHYLKTVDELGSIESYANCLFILITDPHQKTMQRIKQLQIPGVVVLLYNHTLALGSVKEMGELAEVKLIVGENRQHILYEVIQKLKRTYWRCIPLERFNIDITMLSPRIVSALKYIESVDMSDCTTNNIAAHLHINPCYFSQKFKRETGVSFRSFMQKVLNYYEDYIFSKGNLPATNISQLLGYSELSSFSRSFKKRKGVSPTKYKKMVKV